MNSKRQIVCFHLIIYLFAALENDSMTSWHRISASSTLSNPPSEILFYFWFFWQLGVRTSLLNWHNCVLSAFVLTRVWKWQKFYTLKLQFFIPNCHIEHIRAHQWELAKNPLYHVLVWIKGQNPSGLFRYGHDRAWKFGKKGEKTKSHKWDSNLQPIGY